MIIDLLQQTRPLRRLPVGACYLLSGSMVAAALGARFALAPLFASPYLPFIPAIIAAALLFDRGAGYFAALLATAAALFLETNRDPGALDSTATAVTLLMFAGVGLLIAAVLEALRGTVDELAAANHGLEESEAQLARAEAEKSLLLREMNHRVKNDLQSLVAVADLQARRIADPAARHVLDALSQRMAVLSQIHDKLQAAKGSVEIDAGAFVAGLCRDLHAAHVGRRPIALKVDAAHARVRADLAVPLGLLVNELVTNATKHAFPAGREGTISVALGQVQDGLVLRVADDGVGVSEGRANSGREGGIGSRLIRALAAQLGGTMEAATLEPGTAITVRLPDTLVPAQVAA